MTHTAEVNQHHQIYPRERQVYTAKCSCGWESASFARRSEAEAWVEIHERTEREHAELVAAYGGAR